MKKEMVKRLQLPIHFQSVFIKFYTFIGTKEEKVGKGGKGKKGKGKPAAKPPSPIYVEVKVTIPH